jgi:uncharacterized membrane protein YbhN (UPF0104 family)
MTIAVDAGTRQVRRRRYWLLGIKLAVSFGLLAWLARGLGLRSIASAMATASPPRLVLAGMLLAASHLLASWQWGRLLARAGVKVRPGRVVGYTWAAALGNLVLPTGAGGDVARVIGVGRESGDGPAVLGATLVDRILGLTSLASLGLLGLPVLEPLAGSHGGRAVILALCLNIAVSLGLLFLVLGPARAKALSWLARRLPGRSGTEAGRLGRALDEVRVRQGVLPLASIALGVQICRVLAHAQVARALDIPLGLGYFFAFVPLLAVAVSVPVSVGGIGVRESLGAFLFGMLGIDAARGSAMQLLTYLLTIAVTLPGALAFILLSRPPAQVTAAGDPAR